MKKVLWKVNYLNLPDLDSFTGNGTLTLTDGLYHEYQYKLNELLKVAEEIYRIAQQQGLNIDGR